jgi:branched-chain amino acid transport system ATP-binding protein
LFPRLTIEENLQMGLYHDAKRFGERFDYVAEPVPWRWATRRKQRAGSLSGGERQMVAMGRA